MPVPRLRGPRDRGPLARLAWGLLRSSGWHVVLAQPVPARCVIVFYPHTSNWDFVIGLLAKWVVAIRVHWVGKHSLFRAPFGPLFVRWGGIPVDRRRRTGFIQGLRDAFAGRDEFRLAIAPEGTRARTDRWRSGFYHLARAVEVPVALGFIDYARKEVGIGGYVDLSGSVGDDMAHIAAFYADKHARVPANAGPVGLGRPPGS